MQHDPSSVFDTREDLIWLTLIVLLGLVPRLALIAATGGGIESDEAIVGLMAKHIADGREIPIFYYGQHYMGSLEPLLAAGAFKLFGQSNFVLKLVPLLFSLALIVLVYYLARCFTDRFGARTAALLTAIAPSTLILWSTKARGGFIELVVIGTLALLLSVRLIENKDPRPKGFFVLGLVLGLGWWVNNQIIFYIAAIGVVFLVYFGAHRGLRWGIGNAVWASLGFLLGGLPFWYYNLFETPRLATFRQLLEGQQPGSGFMDHLRGYFVEALPILLGARRFWSDHDVVAGTTIAAYALYAVAAAGAAFIWLRGRQGASPGRNAKYGLLLAFMLAVPLVFSASSFGWLSKAPRYLLPLYSVLFVLAGIAISGVRRVRFVGAPLSALLLTSFLGIHLLSNYYGGLAVPGQPFLFRGARVAADHQQLYSWLKSRNYRHIYTNYWIGYRTAFETDETITFSRFRGPRTRRISAYEHYNAEFEEFSPYVLAENEAAIVARSFSELGYQFRTTRVGEYVVLDHVRLPGRDDEEIPLRPEQLWVAQRPKWAPHLVDNDLGSRWGSGVAQQPGMTISLFLGEVKPITGIDMEMGFFRHDAPRELVIEARTPENDWCALFDSRGTEIFSEVRDRAFVETPRKWQFRFPPQPASTIRLVQEGSDPVLDWSIAELDVYSLSRSSSGA